MKRFQLSSGGNLKFGMKQVAKVHTQTRFLKFTKRSWEDELTFGEPFGFFWWKMTLWVTFSWTRKTVFWRYTTFYNEIVCKHWLTLRKIHVFPRKHRKARGFWALNLMDPIVSYLKSSCAFPSQCHRWFQQAFFSLCKRMNETLYPKSDIHGVFVNFLLRSAHACRLSRIEWSLDRKHLTFLEATCLCSFSECSLRFNK